MAEYSSKKAKSLTEQVNSASWQCACAFLPHKTFISAIWAVGKTKINTSCESFTALPLILTVNKPETIKFFSGIAHEIS
jgi:hypothetical protein